MRIAFHLPHGLSEEGIAQPWPYPGRSASGGGPSGDRIVASLLVSGLRARGHTVEVVSSLPIDELWRGTLGIGAVVREAARVRRRMRSFGPDVWLVCGPTANYPDVFGWWQRPPRYVLFGAGLGSGGRQRRWRRLLRAAHVRALRGADAVTTYVPAIVPDLAARRRRHDVVVLPPVARSWTEVPSRAEARRQLGLDADRPVVLCVSRLTVGKTTPVVRLLDIVATLPDSVRLVLVGDGPGRAAVEDAVARLGLGGRVTRLAPRLDLAPVYAAADVFAFPDDRDLPRLAILEAQGCGLPVVTTSTPSSESIVDPGVSGVLVGGDDELRAELDALLADPERRERMGAAGRVYIRDRHSPEVRVRQVEALMTEQAETTVAAGGHEPPH